MKTKPTALSKDEMDSALKPLYKKACRAFKKEYGTLKGLDTKLASLKNTVERKAYLDKLIETLERVAEIESDPLMN